jgi:hypothetical protein
MAITENECAFEDFNLLVSEELPPDNSCIGGVNECVFELPVFAYPSDTGDTYRNDFSAPLVFVTNKYKDPKLYLEVLVGCTWTEVAELTDGMTTYGTSYSFVGSDWVGFKLDWYLVYNNEGVGIYRIRQEITNIQTLAVEISYGYRFNLRLWNENLADKTTKLTYTVNGGKMPNVLNDKQVLRYNDIVWEREIRLPSSFFGFESSEYTIESTRYKNGGQQQTKNEQIQTIKYNAKKLPYSLHNEIRSTALQCGELYISDYNLGNPKKYYDHFRVKLASDYSPTWGTYNTYAPVQLEFNPYYENLRRKLC